MTSAGYAAPPAASRAWLVSRRTSREPAGGVVASGERAKGSTTHGSLSPMGGRLLGALLLALAMIGVCGTAPAGGADSSVGQAEVVEPEEGVAPSAGAWWTREALRGEWGGWPKALLDRGVTLGIAYTGDAVGIVSGGVHRRAEYLDDWDLTLELDPEPLLAWSGARLLLYGLGLWSTGSPSEDAGDIQTLDNIDARPQWTLYEAWLEQRMLGGRLSLLAGIYDVNRDFDAIEAATLFLNSSFGVGKDFSQSGASGPSIFPDTAVGVRLDARPVARGYARLAVLDGAPSDGDGSRSVPSFFAFSGKDGVLCVGEAGYLSGEDAGADDPYMKVGFGGWFYSAEFDRIDGVGTDGEPSRRTGSHGLYLLAERALARWAGAPERGLTAFARVGFADSEVNPIGFFAGGGAVYTGPTAARPDDQIGLGVAAAIAGHEFESAAEEAGTPVDGAEIAIELTYRAQITSWLSIQPDLQYIVNPGLTGGVENALALGARVGITY